MLALLATEVVMTMMFLVVILGATDDRAPAGLAPIAIIGAAVYRYIGHQTVGEKSFTLGDRQANSTMNIT